MKKKLKESKKRIRGIVLIILITAMLLIMSTYAWFSTQKDIVLSNLKGRVKVAEGLEVSLDGETWGNEIDLSNLTHNGTTIVKPDEMIPVSTMGETGGTALTMLRGTISKKKILKNVKACVESVNDPKDETYPGYIAFDMYLKNTNRLEEPTNLQLNQNSIVKVPLEGNEKSGIQNAVRIGFAKYTDSIDTLSEPHQVTGTNYGVIDQVAVWEPNSKAHVPYVVKNNNIADEPFTDNKDVHTYGLLKSAVDQQISDIYQKNTYSELQNTVKTNSSNKLTVDEGIQELKSVADGKTPFTIPANKISKIRVYVWLEGGDIDCINYASHGGGIDVTIGLIKD